MKPLSQWICDTCGQLIEKPEDGYLEWLSSPEEGVREFRIVHHAPKSPYWEGRGSGSDCYKHTKHPHRHDLHLDSFLGPVGLAHFFSFMDVGEVLDPDNNGPRRIADMRNFVETFRRLHLPHYEEARFYYGKARDNGDLDGANELTPYLPGFMKRIIEDYREDE